MKKFLTASALIIMIFIFSFPAQAQFFFMENQLEGKPAPEFKLKKISGAEESLANFRDGKKAIVFFWATWCPHCRKELDVMNNQIQTFNQKGIKVAAVNLGEKSGMVKKFAEKNKIKLDVFLDEKSTLEDPYSIIGLPTLVFIGQDGVVTAVKHSLPKDLDKIFEVKSSKID